MGLGSLNGPRKSPGRWVWRQLIKARGGQHLGWVWLALDPRDKSRDLRHQKSRRRWEETGMFPGQNLASRDHVITGSRIKSSKTK